MAAAIDEKAKESAPKAIRILVRIWGFVAALCMLSTGLFVLITITGKCLFAGIIQVCAGALVVPLEAPIFCTSFPTWIKISDWFEDHLKFWMRTTLYLIFGIPPIILCPEISTIVGSGALLVLAALYGMLAIGKKGGAVERPLSSPKHNDDDVELKAKLMTSTGEPNDLNTY